MRSLTLLVVLLAIAGVCLTIPTIPRWSQMDDVRSPRDRRQMGMGMGPLGMLGGMNSMGMGGMGYPMGGMGYPMGGMYG